MVVRADTNIQPSVRQQKFLVKTGPRSDELLRLLRNKVISEICLYAWLFLLLLVRPWQNKRLNIYRYVHVVIISRRFAVATGTTGTTK